MTSAPPFYSPGPWTVYHDGYSVADETGHILSTQCEGRTDAEAKANARLIAAAPDLVIGLIAMLRAKSAAEIYKARAFSIAILAQVDRTDA